MDKLTKNGLNNVVPEKLFDDLEIVFDDLKDGKKVNSEIKERIETPLEAKLTAMSKLKWTIELR